MKKVSILIADDHPIIRNGLHSLINLEEDLDVIGEASDGEEAVKLVNELQPDVVIMDIVMPKLNGIEATRLIKQSNPTTIVITLTAYTDIEYILGLLEAGASGYILKDAHGKELIDAIRAARSGESVLDPVVTRILLERVHGEAKNILNNLPIVALTPREIEVLEYASRGLSNKDIANQLSLSLRTVKAHLTNIFSKMGCGSRTDAIIKGLKAGYITLNKPVQLQKTNIIQN
jgi:two-component system, NarL family, response regulator LiaR